MKRIVIATLSTVVGLVLLLSFKSHSLATAQVAPTVVRTPSSSASSSAGSADPTTAPSTSATSAATTPATTSPSAAASSGTFTGQAADTRYGPVQVQITVTDGKITAANAVEYPENDGRDAQINAYAVPQLDQETVAAGSAQIDVVSGATYTSDGYLTSLQSALDQAGLG